MKIDKKDIANFIVTNGRPNNQLTYNFLSARGVDNIYLVCDNLDETLDEYKRIYGDKVLVFDKVQAEKETDTGINDGRINHVVFARNMCFKFAKQLGFKYFFMYDDDISYISYRYNADNSLKSYMFRDFGKALEVYTEYLANNENLYAIGFANSNMLRGGINSDIFNGAGLLRQVYAVAVYCVDRVVKYRSTGFEDYLTSVLYNKVGRLMVALPFLNHNAVAEGRNGGVFSEIYNNKAYEFRWLTKIFIPAHFDITDTVEHRLRNNYFPMIINERYKKQC